MNNHIKSQCDAHANTAGSLAIILAGFLNFVASEITGEHKDLTGIDVLKCQMCRCNLVHSKNQINLMVQEPLSLMLDLTVSELFTVGQVITLKQESIIFTHLTCTRLPVSKEKFGYF